MTLLVTNDTEVVCRIQLTGEGRWISLALSLSGLASAPRFLVGAKCLVYEMAGVDELAQTYGLANWQGGVISGARYAFRSLKAPVQPVCLHELRGQLSSADVWAVSAAAARAVARLLGSSPDFPLELGGWTIEEEIHSPQSAEAITQSAKDVSTQPNPLQKEAENSSPASVKTGTNGGTQELPTEMKVAERDQ